MRDPHAYAIQIDGDSMTPRVRKGDIVIVAPTHDIVNGDLAVAKTLEGEVLLKEIRYQDGHVILSSTNPAYDPIKKDFQFIHRVVMIKPK